MHAYSCCTRGRMVPDTIKAPVIAGAFGRSNKPLEIQYVPCENNNCERIERNRRNDFYQFVRLRVQGLRVIAVDHSELVDQRHVRKLVDEIVVAVVASGILVDETALFQLEAFVVVRIRGGGRGPVVVAEQYALGRLRLLVLVVQQRLLQGYAVEVHVFLDVTTVRPTGLAVVSGSQFFSERGHQ